jgi:hypothetical protein
VSLSKDEAITTRPDQIVSQEARDYELAASVGSSDAWDAFLRKYPVGFYSDLARLRVAKTISGKDALPKEKLRPAKKTIKNSAAVSNITVSNTCATLAQAKTDGTFVRRAMASTTGASRAVWVAVGRRCPQY